MKEVFRHYDSSTVALLDGLLRDAGMQTLLKNFTGGNIVEVPIPCLYPSIFVLDADDAPQAKALIEDYLNHQPHEGPDWLCPECGREVDGFLAECWSCQSPRPEPIAGAGGS
jgi:hypothetical protein